MNHLVLGSGLHVIDGYPAPVLYGFSPEADSVVESVSVEHSGMGDKVLMRARTYVNGSPSDAYTMSMDPGTFAGALTIRAYAGGAPIIAVWPSGARLVLDMRAVVSADNGALASVVGARVARALAASANLGVMDELSSRIEGLATFTVRACELSENPSIRNITSRSLEPGNLSMLAGATNAGALESLRATDFDSFEKLVDVSSAAFRTQNPAVSFPYGLGSLAVLSLLGDKMALESLKKSGFFEQLLEISERSPEFGNALMVGTATSLFLAIDTKNPAQLRENIVSSVPASIIENESFSMSSINDMTDTVQKLIVLVQEARDSLMNSGSGQSSVMGIKLFSSVDEILLFMLVISAFASSSIYGSLERDILGDKNVDITVNVVQDVLDSFLRNVESVEP